MKDLNFTLKYKKTMNRKTYSYSKIYFVRNIRQNLQMQKEKCLTWWQIAEHFQPEWEAKHDATVVVVAVAVVVVH